MQTQKRVLLTGATGFLGSRLALTLLNLGHEIIVLKRKGSDVQRIKSLMTRVVFYDVEDVDFATLFSAHGQIHAVIHTATCYGRAGEGASKIAEANIVLPLRILEAAALCKVGIFINTDTMLLKNLNDYALSKAQFQEWGKALSVRKKIRFVNVKLDHFFGPGDADSKFTTHVIKSCLANVPELDFTLGEQKRDFIYIDDAVAAYLKVFEHAILSNENFLEYEVGSGNSVSIKDFVALVKRVTHSATRANFGRLSYRENEVMDCQVNIESLKAIGWKCRVDLALGIELTIRDLRKNFEI